MKQMRKAMYLIPLQKKIIIIKPQTKTKNLNYQFIWKHIYTNTFQFSSGKYDF